MRMLTLSQPWAALVAAGVKTIETRSWSTPYRGPIAIHAAKKIPAGLHLVKVGAWTIHSRFTEPESPPEIRRVGSVHGGALVVDRYEKGLAAPLHLGAVVAVADLVDVAPIIDGSLGWTGDSDTPPAAVVVSWDVTAMLVDCRETGPSPDCTDQLPYGDFTAGRYAWLLENVRAIGPVPAKGHQGLRDVPGAVLPLVLGELEAVNHG